VGRWPLAANPAGRDDRSVTDRHAAPPPVTRFDARETHWDTIYERGEPDELRWHEPVPSTLPLVLAHSARLDPVIDIGGGASRLSNQLLVRGYLDLTVLDLSETALIRGRHVMGCNAGAVEWLHADATRFTPYRRWCVWHDRAVFHFLVDEADRDGYRRAAAAGVAPGGVIVVATFGPDGPESCAGLPVCRYDAPSLAAEFADDFEPLVTTSLEPSSAAGDQRPYVAAVLRRRGESAG